MSAADKTKLNVVNSDYKTAYKEVYIAANNSGNLAQLSLTAGIWLIIGFVDFNATVNQYNVSITGPNNFLHTVRAWGANGGGTNNVIVHRVTAGTFTLVCWTPTAATARGTMYAIKLAS